jgi:hypothetical protein
MAHFSGFGPAVSAAVAPIGQSASPNNATSPSINGFLAIAKLLVRYLFNLVEKTLFSRFEKTLKSN